MSKPRTTESYPQRETLDPRAHILPIWRWKWVVVLVVLLAAGGAYFLSSRMPKQYVASTRLYVQEVDPAASLNSSQPPNAPSAQSMQDLAELLTAQSITTAVDRQLGLPLGSRPSVTVSPLEGANATPTSFLVVSATAHTPALAARVANAYITSFLAARRQAQAAEATADVHATQRELAALADTPANAAERQALLTQESQLRTAAFNPSAGAQQTNVAVPPNAPSSPRPIRDAVLAGIVGLLLGLGIAFGLEMLDRRLFRVSAVESQYRLPVLAVLPHSRKPQLTHAGRAVVPPDFVEAIRALRLSLGLALGNIRQRTLLVTSGLPGEGKTTVVRDLALVYAEAGESVLVIDADLRRPRIANLLGAPVQQANAVGLTHLLRGEVRGDDAVSRVLSDAPRKTGINAGVRGARGGPPSRGSIDVLRHREQAANPVALLSSAAMIDTLAAAAQRYDIVIIDSAPLLAVADSVPLLNMVSAVLLVARLGLATRESADRLHALLDRASATNVVGVVTNDLRGAYLDEGYAYDYRSRYGEGGASSSVADMPPPLLPSDSR